MDRRVHDLTDHTAVHHGDDEFVGVLRRHAVDAPPHVILELVSGFSAEDHVPALLDLHELGDRIAVGDPLAELAALPFPEEQLTQVGDDDRREAEAVDERLGGLHGPSEVAT